MQKKKVFQIIFLLSLLTLIFSQDIKEYEMNDYLGNFIPFENANAESQSFQYKFKANSSFGYYIVRTYDDDNERLSSSPMHIYMQIDSPASASNYYRASNLYHQNIIAVKRNFTSDFYVTVTCPYQCKGKLTYYTSDYVHLNLNEHFEFFGGENYTIALKKENVFVNEGIQVVLLGPQLNIPSEYMQFGYIHNETRTIILTDDLPVPGLLINNSELSYVFHANKSKYNDAYKYILVRIGGPDGHFMRFITRHVGFGQYHVGDPAMYSLKGLPDDFLREECVQIYGQVPNKNYQLRIITTTALDLKVDEEQISMGYMSDFYQNYLISGETKLNNICFISKETTDKYGQEYQTDKQAFYFQIVESKEYSRYSILEPLYEGWVYKDQFDKGEVKIYRHAKWTDRKTNLIVLSRKGALNIYQGKCTSFPYCSDFQKYENLSKLIYAFSAFVSSIDPRDETTYGDSSQVVHYVECMDSSGCEISIEYVDQYEIVHIRENENHAKFIEYGMKENYKMYVEKGDDVQAHKVELTLEIFSGDAVIEFENNEIREKGQYLFYGSTEKFIFDYDVVAHQTILFSVIARKITYYVVSYRLVSENDVTNIGESGLLLQLIAGTGITKHFTFYHLNRIKDKTPYVVNFIPINCEIDVYFEKEDSERIQLKPNLLNQYEDIFDIGDSKFQIEKPKYSVKFRKYKYENSSDNYCNVYVGASESSKNLPSLIRENSPYSRTLSKNYPKASFVWPFAYIKGYTNIKINLRNEVRLKVDISINDGDPFSSVISKSALLDIPVSYFSKCSESKGCPILLDVELEKESLIDGMEYPIEISLSVPKKTPFQLQKGVFRRSGVNNNQTDYYYLEVEKDEEGEITLDLKRGSGILFAKIARKGYRNDAPNAWARQMVLPTIDKFDKNLVYDPYTQSIKYDKGITGKCVKGCFIVFGVSTKDNYTELQSFFNSEYSIIPRFIKRGREYYDDIAVNIPINEFIFGMLSENFNTQYSHIYKFDVIDSYQGIEIEYRGKDALMFITWEKQVANYSQCFISQGINTTQILKLMPSSTCGDSKLPQSLKGLQFQFDVEGGFRFESGAFAPYYFRVRPVYENRPHIIELNSDKETTCEIQNGKCHFIIPLYSYDDVSNLILYADTPGKNDVVFYIKVVETKAYDSCNVKSCFEDFLPTDSDTSSKSQPNTKYITLETRQITKNNYIMVTVKSDSNKYVSVASSFKTYADYIVPTPNFVQVLNIRRGITQNISLDGFTLNSTIIGLSGNGEVELGNTKMQINLDEPINLPLKQVNKILKIKNTGEKDLSVVLRYNYYRTSTESIKEITVNETLGNSYPFEFSKKTQIVFNVTVVAEKRYTIFRTYAADDNQSGMHILYDPHEIPTIQNYERASNLYVENILPVKDIKHFYITVLCPGPCHGNLTYYSSDYIHLGNNDHFEFIGGEEYNIAIRKDAVSSKETMQVMLLGPQIELKPENMKISNSENGVTITCVPNVGLLIEKTELSCIFNPNEEIYQEKNVYIRVSGPTGAYMRFTTRVIGNSKYTITNPAIYILKNNSYNIFETECIDIIGGRVGKTYQFRLFTTYPLSLSFLGNTIQRDVGYMSDLYEFYTVKENVKPNICFKSNDTVIDGQKKTEKQAFYFQIIEQELEEGEPRGAVLEPLFEEWVYDDVLAKGESRYYRTAKWIQNKANLFIMSRGGRIQVNYGYCDKFPYCYLNSERRFDVQNYTQVPHAFNAFIITIDPKDAAHLGTPKQLIHSVYCADEEGCQIRIHYTSKDIQLKENQNHAKYLKEGDNDIYELELIENPKEGDKLEINLDIFSGDVSIQFPSQLMQNNYDYIFYGTSEKYIFNCTDIKEHQIKFSIIGRQYSYYVISYRYIEADKHFSSIGEGGLLFQAIKGGVYKTRVFQFWHNNPTKSNIPYIVNFFPINCEIEVSYLKEEEKRPIKPNSLGYFEDILLSNTEHTGDYYDFYPKYEVTFKQFKRNKPKDNYCYFYAGASESSEEIPTFLRENLPFKTSLSKKIKTAHFSWPYPYIKGDVEIKINLGKEKTLEIRANQLVRTISKSSTIELPADLLDYSQESFNRTTIDLEVSIKDENIKDDDVVPIEISLSSSRKTPQIIEKGILRMTASNDDSINYFYFDVQSGEEGEISLDFKRGNGIMFAKITKKQSEIADEKAWRKKVILPTDKNFDEKLKFNPLTNKIKYNSEVTKDCGDSGCFIVFGVKTTIDIKAFKSLFVSEYNIMVKYIEKGEENLPKVAIEIPINEFINGFVEDTSTNKYYDAYNLEILDSYEGIEIEYKSSNATMSISWENDYKTQSSCGIYPNTNEVQILKIKVKERCNDLLIPDQLKGAKFRFVISTDKLQNDNNSPYYFRVRPIYKGRPHVIDINSDKETTCELDSNKNCHFLIPLFSYDELSTIVLYADTEHDIAFYAKSISSEAYQECGESFSCYDALIPNPETPTSYDIVQKKNFLTSNNLRFDRNNFILGTIHSRGAKKVPIASTMRTFVHSSYPTPYSIQLVYITPNNRRYINITKYIENIKVIHLNGEGNLTLSDHSYQISQGQLDLINTADNAEFKIENKHQEQDLILAIKYSQKNISEIREIIVEDNIYGKNESIYSLRPLLFKFKAKIPAQKKYAIFRTYVKDYTSAPLHLYLSKTGVPTIDSYERASILYHQNIIAYKGEIGEVYVSVYCSGKCDGNLTYYSSDYIHLSQNDHYEYEYRGESDYLSIKIDSLPVNDALQLTLLGPQIPLKKEYMKVGLLKNGVVSDVENLEEGLLIQGTELSCIVHPKKYENEKKIYIELKGPTGQYLRFTTRHIGNSHYYIGDPAVYFLKSKNNDMFKEDCIDFVGGKLGQIYQLRLVTTYGIAMYINGQHNTSAGYMSNYYHDYILEHDGQKTTVCFNSTKKTRVNEKDEDTPKQAFYFQVVNSDSNQMQSIIEPLYEGWKYEDTLNYLESRFYRHAKYTTSKTNVYIISNYGTLNVYQTKCTSFPYCLDSKNYENPNKLIYAFSAFVSSINATNESYYGYTKPMIHVVKCLHKQGCTLSINYYSQDHPILIKENQNHGKFIYSGEKESYQFINENSPDRTNYYVEINLDVLSGDAILNLHSSIQYDNHLFYGSSEKYIIDPTKIENIYVNFTVDAKEDSYYVVSFRDVEKTEERSFIGESGLLMQYLNNDKIKERSFHFWHNSYTGKTSPYVVNVIPINCDIEVNNTKINQTSIYEQILTPEKPEYNQLDLYYHVKLPENSNKENCYFYVGASESSLELPTLLREDVPYSRTLSSKTRNATFSWPFPYKTGNTVIKINLQNEFSINAEIFINDNKKLDYSIARSTVLIVEEQSLSSCSKTGGCQITLNLELTSFKGDDMKVPVEVSLSTGRKTPQILKKGILRRDGMIDKKQNYYYFEVGKNEEGEILLDFKRGGGVMYAKIVNKDDHIKSDFAWFNKVELPNETNYDKQLEYDYANQRIKVSSEHTSNCENLCFIVIGVFSKFKFGGYESLFSSEYSILFRNKIKDKNKETLEKAAINIPINEFISGSPQEKEIFDTYLLEFMDSYNGFEIEFKSLKAILHLSLGDEFLTDDSCIIGESKDLQFSRYISGSKCGEQTIPTIKTGVKIRISIAIPKSLKDYNNGDYAPYYFRVRPFYSERIHFIEINSDKETTCKINNQKCLFLIPLYSWDGMSNVILYINDGNKNMRDPIIQYKHISSLEYERCESDDCRELCIPGQYNNSTINQENSKYAIISGRGAKKTDYIMVAIVTESTQNIPIVTSMKNFYDQIIPKPNYGQLIYIYEKEKKYVNLNDYISQVNVTSITGKGVISINDFKYDIPSPEPIVHNTHRMKSNIEVENKESLIDLLILLQYNYENKASDSKIINVTEEKHNNQFFFSETRTSFNYEVNIKHNKKYTIFRTYGSEEKYGPMHLFINDNEIASQYKYKLAGHLYRENIIGLRNNDKKHYYLTVVCPEECKGNLTYYASDYIHMDLNEHFEFMGEENYTLALDPKQLDKNESLQLILLGPQQKSDLKYLQVAGLTNNKETILQPGVKQGLLINDMDLSCVLSKDDFKDYEKILVKVTGIKGQYMRFMSRHIGHGKYYIGEPAVYSLKSVKNDFIKDECVNVYGLKEGIQYEVRLISASDITLTINKKQETVSAMNDFMTLYTPPNKDGKLEVCFKSNEKTKKDGKEQNTEKQALYFQVLNHEKDVIKNVIEPLYEGWKYVEHIKTGQTKIFRHAKVSNHKTNIYVLVNNGFVDVHQIKCIAFPYCDNSNYYESDTKLIYAFSAFVSSTNPKEETHYGNHTQIIHAVTCKSQTQNKDCDVSIRYFNTYDLIYLKENENHGKFLKKGDDESYEFVASQEKNLKVEVNLDVFVGDASLEFDSDRIKDIKYEYVFFGSSEKYIFDDEKVKGKTIKFWIKAKSNCYYVVSFREIETKNEDSKIGESGYVIKAIKGKDKEKKTYGFWHNNPSNTEVPYVVNFIPINCHINVWRNNTQLHPNSIGHYEDILSYSDSNTGSYFSENHPIYQAQFTSFSHNSPNDDYCYFYVGGGESSSDIPVLLRESMVYTRTLTQKFRKVDFLLPFPYINGDVDVKINMKNLYKMIATVTVNNKFISNYTFIGSTLIEITEISLADCENINGCAIGISLYLNHLYDLNDTKVPIEIVFSTARKTPSILQKGVLRRTGINANSTDYYYLEVSKEEEGEIILNFKRGIGIMFGKLVKKDNKTDDINAWRKKVILPTEKDNDNFLSYNPITQKIKYIKNHTRICEKGCFLIIGVQNKENYVGHNILFTLEYTIFARYIELKADSKVAINVPDNEYIYGSLEETSSKGQYDTYVYDVFDDYQSIEIEFKSDKALMYYSDSTFEKSKNKIESNNKIVVHNIKDIKKGKQLKLTVSTSQFSYNNITVYSFKIRPIHKHRISLLELSGDKPTICNANADSICNFYLPFNTYDGISQLILYADSKEEVFIYIRRTDSNFFANCIDEECIKSALPKSDKYDKTQKQYLTLDSTKYKKEDVLLIAVTTRTKQLISLYATFKSPLVSTIPTLNSLQIIDVSPNSNQTINLNDYINSLNIKYIQGKGLINYGKAYNLEKANTTTKIERIKDKNNLVIENKDKNKDLIIAVEYLVNKEQINPPKKDPNDPKKKEPTKGKGGLPIAVVIVLILVLVVLVILGAWWFIKNKQQKDRFKKTVDQLSLTLSGKEIDKRQPLLKTNEMV